MQGKNSFPKRYLFFGGVVSLLIILALTLLLIPNQEQNPQAAYEFTVPTTSGSLYSLKDDLGQKMIILDFMATWCNPCIQIGFALRELKNNYDMVSIVSISISPSDTAPILANWSSAWGFDWTFVPYNNLTDTLMEQYNVTLGIPASVVIDLEGLIRIRHTGVVDYETLETWAKEILPSQ